MVSAIFFLIEKFLIGLIAIKFFDKRNLLSVSEKITGAIALGFVLGFLEVLLFSLILKNLNLGITAGFVLEFAVIFWQIKYLRTFFDDIYGRIRKLQTGQITELTKNFLPIGLILLVWVMIVLSVVYEDSSGLKVVALGWGDTAFHMSIVERLANADPFRLDHPFYSGAPITYPFLINFASAVLLKLGLRLILAYHLPAIIMGLAGILLLFLLAKRVFSSSFWAVLVIVIMLFGSGLGFMLFFKDVQIASLSSVSPISETLSNPPHSYTQIDTRGKFDSELGSGIKNISWIVPAVAFLSHSRSFTWGLALFGILLLFLWLYRNDRSLWKFGVLSGFLPIVHGHTFIAVMIGTAGRVLSGAGKNWRQWILFGAASLICALPLLVFFNQGMGFLNQGESQSFFRLQFGWMTCSHGTDWLSCLPQIGTDTNVIDFWTRNFGVIFWVWTAFIIFSIFRPLNILIPETEAFSWPKTELKSFLDWIIVPSLLLFVLPNIMLFQPWEYDNSKILFHWWIMASFIAVGFLYYLVWIVKNRWGKMLIKAVAAILIFFGIFSGIIDVQARISDFSRNHYGYWDEPHRIAAQWIKENTDPNALFLTGTSVSTPTTIIAGRGIYLGYPGWLWVHGIKYADRENKIRQVLQNNDMDLACKEKINYILLDNNLLESYPLTNVEILKEKKIVYEDQLNNIFLVKLECGN